MNFKNLMLFIGSVCFSLLIVEVCLRWFTVFPIDRRSINRIYDEHLGYRVNQLFPDIDDNGFRNTQSVKKADIVALGDSFTYGYNVHSEKTWPQQLAHMTNKIAYNFGVGGYGILQYYYLTDDAIKLQPQHIIMGICIGNDLTDMCELLTTTDFWKKWAEDSGYHIESCGHANQSNLDTQRGLFDRTLFTLRKTAVGSFIAHYIGLSSYIQVALAKIRISTNINKDNAVIINEKLNKTIITHGILSMTAMATDINQPNIALAFEIAKNLIGEIKKKTDLNNINFGIILIPSKQNVFFDYLREKDYQLPEIFHRSVTNERVLVDKFSSFFREIGVEFVDALPYVVHELYKSGNVYPVTVDGHPLEKGYKAYAQAAYDYIFVPK